MYDKKSCQRNDLNSVTSVYNKWMVAGIKKHLSHEGTSSTSHG